jgi:glycosyltransferase involved in cell wall biosynthesis
MRIALFDHVVAAHNPPGACDIQVLHALRSEHEVTVFTSELAVPDDVRHVSVPTVRKPRLASFVVYLALACISYARLRRGAQFDAIHTTDCSFGEADVCYAHFCHRAFLADVWPRVRGAIGPRTLHTWANHTIRALIESRLVRRARVVVVPSEGLKRDLVRVYGVSPEKIVVIRNTVDLTGFARPDNFDSAPVRRQMRAHASDTVFVFVALGHFERKGLPTLLEALAVGGARLASAHLWVIGGEPAVVASYRARAERLGIASQVAFAGRTEDVRPFLWSADAFVAPSHYEAFSLGLLEAAAAGLPLIATRISGSEELLEDGVNALEVQSEPASLSAGLCRFLALDSHRREAMGHAARASVEPLAPERFAQAWKDLYASLGG